MGVKPDITLEDLENSQAKLDDIQTQEIPRISEILEKSLEIGQILPVEAGCMEVGAEKRRDLDALQHQVASIKLERAAQIELLSSFMVEHDKLNQALDTIESEMADSAQTAKAEEHKKPKKSRKRKQKQSGSEVVDPSLAKEWNKEDVIRLEDDLEQARSAVAKAAVSEKILGFFGLFDGIHDQIKQSMKEASKLFSRLDSTLPLYQEQAEILHPQQMLPHFDKMEEALRNAEELETTSEELKTGIASRRLQINDLRTSWEDVERLLRRKMESIADFEKRCSTLTEQLKAKDNDVDHQLSLDSPDLEKKLKEFEELLGDLQQLDAEVMNLTQTAETDLSPLEWPLQKAAALRESLRKILDKCNGEIATTRSAIDDHQVVVSRINLLFEWIIIITQRLGSLHPAQMDSNPQEIIQEVENVKSEIEEKRPEITELAQKMPEKGKELKKSLETVAQLANDQQSAANDLRETQTLTLNLQDEITIILTQITTVKTKTWETTDDLVGMLADLEKQQSLIDDKMPQVEQLSNKDPATGADLKQALDSAQQELKGALKQSEANQSFLNTRDMLLKAIQDLLNQLIALKSKEWTDTNSLDRSTSELENLKHQLDAMQADIDRVKTLQPDKSPELSRHLDLAVKSLEDAEKDLTKARESWDTLVSLNQQFDDALLSAQSNLSTEEPILENSDGTMPELKESLARLESLQGKDIPRLEELLSQAREASKAVPANSTAALSTPEKQSALDEFTVKLGAHSANIRDLIDRLSAFLSDQDRLTGRLDEIEKTLISLPQPQDKEASKSKPKKSKKKKQKHPGSDQPDAPSSPGIVDATLLTECLERLGQMSGDVAKLVEDGNALTPPSNAAPMARATDQRHAALTKSAHDEVEKAKAAAAAQLELAQQLNSMLALFDGMHDDLQQALLHDQMVAEGPDTTTEQYQELSEKLQTSHPNLQKMGQVLQDAESLSPGSTSAETASNIDERKEKLKKLTMFSETLSKFFLQRIQSLKQFNSDHSDVLSQLKQVDGEIQELSNEQDLGKKLRGFENILERLDKSQEKVDALCQMASSYQPPLNWTGPLASELRLMLTNLLEQCKAEISSIRTSIQDQQEQEHRMKLLLQWIIVITTRIQAMGQPSDASLEDKILELQSIKEEIEQKKPEITELTKQMPEQGTELLDSVDSAVKEAEKKLKDAKDLLGAQSESEDLHKYILIILENISPIRTRKWDTVEDLENMLGELQKIRQIIEEKDPSIEEINRRYPEGGNQLRQASSSALQQLDECQTQIQSNKDWLSARDRLLQEILHIDAQISDTRAAEWANSEHLDKLSSNLEALGQKLQPIQKQVADLKVDCPDKVEQLVSQYDTTEKQLEDARKHFLDAKASWDTLILHLQSIDDKLKSATEAIALEESVLQKPDATESELKETVNRLQMLQETDMLSLENATDQAHAAAEVVPAATGAASSVADRKAMLTQLIDSLNRQNTHALDILSRLSNFFSDHDNLKGKLDTIQEKLQYPSAQQQEGKGSTKTKSKKSKKKKPKQQADTPPPDTPPSPSTLDEATLHECNENLLPLSGEIATLNEAAQSLKPLDKPTLMVNELKSQHEALMISIQEQREKLKAEAAAKASAVEQLLTSVALFDGMHDDLQQTLHKSKQAVESSNVTLEECQKQAEILDFNLISPHLQKMEDVLHEVANVKTQLGGLEEVDVGNRKQKLEDLRKEHSVLSQYINRRIGSLAAFVSQHGKTVEQLGKAETDIKKCSAGKDLTKKLQGFEDILKELDGVQPEIDSLAELSHSFDPQIDWTCSMATESQVNLKSLQEQCKVEISNIRASIQEQHEQEHKMQLLLQWIIIITTRIQSIGQPSESNVDDKILELQKIKEEIEQKKPEIAELVGKMPGQSTELLDSVDSAMKQADKGLEDAKDLHNAQSESENIHKDLLALLADISSVRTRKWSTTQELENMLEELEKIRQRIEEKDPSIEDISKKHPDGGHRLRQASSSALQQLDECQTQIKSHKDWLITRDQLLQEIIKIDVQISDARSAEWANSEALDKLSSNVEASGQQLKCMLEKVADAKTQHPDKAEDLVSQYDHATKNFEDTAKYFFDAKASWDILTLQLQSIDDKLKSATEAIALEDSALQKHDATESELKETVSRLQMLQETDVPSLQSVTDQAHATAEVVPAATGATSTLADRKTMLTQLTDTLNRQSTHARDIVSRLSNFLSDHENLKGKLDNVQENFQHPAQEAIRPEKTKSKKSKKKKSKQQADTAPPDTPPSPVTVDKMTLDGCDETLVHLSGDLAELNEAAQSLKPLAKPISMVNELKSHQEALMISIQEGREKLKADAAAKASALEQLHASLALFDGMHDDLQQTLHNSRQVVQSSNVTPEECQQQAERLDSNLISPHLQKMENVLREVANVKSQLDGLDDVDIGNRKENLEDLRKEHSMLSDFINQRIGSLAAFVSQHGNAAEQLGKAEADIMNCSVEKDLSKKLQGFEDILKELNGLQPEIDSLAELSHSFEPQIDWTDVMASESEVNLKNLLEQCKVEISNIRASIQEQQEQEHKMQLLLQWIIIITTRIQSIGQPSESNVDDKILELQKIKEEIEQKKPEIAELVGKMPGQSTELLDSVDSAMKQADKGLEDAKDLHNAQSESENIHKDLLALLADISSVRTRKWSTTQDLENMLEELEKIRQRIEEKDPSIEDISKKHPDGGHRLRQASSSALQQLDECQTQIKSHKDWLITRDQLLQEIIKIDVQISDARSAEWANSEALDKLSSNVEASGQQLKCMLEKVADAKTQHPDKAEDLVSQYDHATKNFEDTAKYFFDAKASWDILTLQLQSIDDKLKSATEAIALEDSALQKHDATESELKETVSRLQMLQETDVPSLQSVTDQAHATAEVVPAATGATSTLADRKTMLTQLTDTLNRQSTHARDIVSRLSNFLSDHENLKGKLDNVQENFQHPAQEAIRPEKTKSKKSKKKKSKQQADTAPPDTPPSPVTVDKMTLDGCDETLVHLSGDLAELNEAAQSLKPLAKPISMVNELKSHQEALMISIQEGREKLKADAAAKASALEQLHASLALFDGMHDDLQQTLHNSRQVVQSSNVTPEECQQQAERLHSNLISPHLQKMENVLREVANVKSQLDGLDDVDIGNRKEKLEDLRKEHSMLSDFINQRIGSLAAFVSQHGNAAEQLGKAEADIMNCSVEKDLSKKLQGFEDILKELNGLQPEIDSLAELSHSFEPQIDWTDVMASESEVNLKNLLEQCKVEISNIRASIQEQQEQEHKMQLLLQWIIIITTRIQSIGQPSESNVDDKILELQKIKEEIEQKKPEIAELVGKMPGQSTELLDSVDSAMKQADKGLEDAKDLHNAQSESENIHKDLLALLADISSVRTRKWSTTQDLENMLEELEKIRQRIEEKDPSIEDISKKHPDGGHRLRQASSSALQQLDECQTQIKSHKDWLITRDQLLQEIIKIDVQISDARSAEWANSEALDKLSSNVEASGQQLKCMLEKVADAKTQHPDKAEDLVSQYDHATKNFEDTAKYFFDAKASWDILTLQLQSIDDKLKSATEAIALEDSALQKHDATESELKETVSRLQMLQETDVPSLQSVTDQAHATAEVVPAATGATSTLADRKTMLTQLTDTLNRQSTHARDIVSRLSNFLSDHENLKGKLDNVQENFQHPSAQEAIRPEKTKSKKSKKKKSKQQADTAPPDTPPSPVTVDKITLDGCDETLVHLSGDLAELNEAAQSLKPLVKPISMVDELKSRQEALMISIQEGREKLKADAAAKASALEQLHASLALFDGMHDDLQQTLHNSRQVVQSSNVTPEECQQQAERLDSNLISPHLQKMENVLREVANVKSQLDGLDDVDIGNRKEKLEDLRKEHSMLSDFINQRIGSLAAFVSQHGNAAEQLGKAEADIKKCSVEKDWSRKLQGFEDMLSELSGVQPEIDSLAELSHSFEPQIDWTGLMASESEVNLKNLQEQCKVEISKIRASIQEQQEQEHKMQLLLEWIIIITTRIQSIGQPSESNVDNNILELQNIKEEIEQKKPEIAELVGKMPGQSTELIDSVDSAMKQADKGLEDAKDLHNAQSELEGIHKDLVALLADISSIKTRKWSGAQDLETMLGELQKIRQKIEEEDPLIEEINRKHPDGGHQLRQTSSSALRELDECKTQIGSSKDWLSTKDQLLHDILKIDFQICDARSAEWANSDHLDKLSSKLEELGQQLKPMQAKVADTKLQHPDKAEDLIAQYDSTTNNFEDATKHFLDAKASWDTLTLHLRSIDDKLKSATEAIAQAESVLEKPDATQAELKETVSRLQMLQDTDVPFLQDATDQAHAVAEVVPAATGAVQIVADRKVMLTKLMDRLSRLNTDALDIVSRLSNFYSDHDELKGNLAGVQQKLNHPSVQQQEEKGAAKAKSKKSKKKKLKHPAGAVGSSPPPSPTYPDAATLDQCGEILLQLSSDTAQLAKAAELLKPLEKPKLMASNLKDQQERLMKSVQEERDKVKAETAAKAIALEQLHASLALFDGMHDDLLQTLRNGDHEVLGSGAKLELCQEWAEKLDSAMISPHLEKMDDILREIEIINSKLFLEAELDIANRRPKLDDLRKQHSVLLDSIKSRIQALATFISKHTYVADRLEKADDGITKSSIEADLSKKLQGFEEILKELNEIQPEADSLTESSHSFDPPLDWTITVASESRIKLDNLREQCKAQIESIRKEMEERDKLESKRVLLLQWITVISTRITTLISEMSTETLDTTVAQLQEIQKELDDKCDEIREMEQCLPDDSDALLNSVSAARNQADDGLKQGELRQAELLQWLSQWSILSEKISDGLSNLKDGVDFLESNLENPNLDPVQFGSPALLRVRDFNENVEVLELLILEVTTLSSKLPKIAGETESYRKEFEELKNRLRAAQEMLRNMTDASSEFQKRHDVVDGELGVLGEKYNSWRSRKLQKSPDRGSMKEKQVSFADKISLKGTFVEDDLETLQDYDQQINDLKPAVDEVVKLSQPLKLYKKVKSKADRLSSKHSDLSLQCKEDLRDCKDDLAENEIERQIHEIFFKFEALHTLWDNTMAKSSQMLQEPSGDLAEFENNLADYLEPSVVAHEFDQLDSWLKEAQDLVDTLHEKKEFPLQISEKRELVEKIRDQWQGIFGLFQIRIAGLKKFMDMHADLKNQLRDKEERLGKLQGDKERDLVDLKVSLQNFDQDLSSLEPQINGLIEVADPLYPLEWPMIQADQLKEWLNKLHSLLEENQSGLQKSLVLQEENEGKLKLLLEWTAMAFSRISTLTAVSWSTEPELQQQLLEIEEIHNEADKKALDISKIQAQLPEMSFGLVQSYETVKTTSAIAKTEAETRLRDIELMKSLLAEIDAAILYLKNTVNDKDSAMRQTDSIRESFEHLLNELAYLESNDHQKIKQLLDKADQLNIPSEVKESLQLSERKEAKKSLELKQNSLYEELQSILHLWDGFYEKHKESEVLLGTLQEEMQSLESGLVSPVKKEKKQRKRKGKGQQEMTALLLESDTLKEAVNRWKTLKTKLKDAENRIVDLLKLSHQMKPYKKPLIDAQNLKDRLSELDTQCLSFLDIANAKLYETEKDIQAKAIEDLIAEVQRKRSEIENTMSGAEEVADSAKANSDELQQMVSVISEEQVSPKFHEIRSLIEDVRMTVSADESLVAFNAAITTEVDETESLENRWDLVLEHLKSQIVKLGRFTEERNQLDIRLRKLEEQVNNVENSEPSQQSEHELGQIEDGLSDCKDQINILSGIAKSLAPLEWPHDALEEFKDWIERLQSRCNHVRESIGAQNLKEQRLHELLQWLKNTLSNLNELKLKKAGSVSELHDDLAQLEAVENDLKARMPDITDIVNDQPAKSKDLLLLKDETIFTIEHCKTVWKQNITLVESLAKFHQEIESRLQDANKRIVKQEAILDDPNSALSDFALSSQQLQDVDGTVPGIHKLILEAEEAAMKLSPEMVLPLPPKTQAPEDIGIQVQYAIDSWLDSLDLLRKKLSNDQQKFADLTLIWKDFEVEADQIEKGLRQIDKAIEQATAKSGTSDFKRTLESFENCKYKLSELDPQLIALEMKAANLKPFVGPTSRANFLRDLHTNLLNKCQHETSKTNETLVKVGLQQQAGNSIGEFDKLLSEIRNTVQQCTNVLHSIDAGLGDFMEQESSMHPKVIEPKLERMASLLSRANLHERNTQMNSMTSSWNSALVELQVRTANLREFQELHDFIGHILRWIENDLAALPEDDLQQKQKLEKLIEQLDEASSKVNGKLEPLSATLRPLGWPSDAVGRFKDKIDQLRQLYQDYIATLNKKTQESEDRLKYLMEWTAGIASQIVALSTASWQTETHLIQRLEKIEHLKAQLGNKTPEIRQLQDEMPKATENLVQTFKSAQADSNRSQKLDESHLKNLRRLQEVFLQIDKSQQKVDNRIQKGMATLERPQTDIEELERLRGSLNVDDDFNAQANLLLQAAAILKELPKDVGMHEIFQRKVDKKEKAVSDLTALMDSIDRLIAWLRNFFAELNKLKQKLSAVNSTILDWLATRAKGAVSPSKKSKKRKPQQGATGVSFDFRSPVLNEEKRVFEVSKQKLSEMKPPLETLLASVDGADVQMSADFKDKVCDVQDQHANLAGTCQFWLWYLSIVGTSKDVDELLVHGDELLNKKDAELEDFQGFQVRLSDTVSAFKDMDKTLADLRDLIASGVAPTALEEYLRILENYITELRRRHDLQNSEVSARMTGLKAFYDLETRLNLEMDDFGVVLDGCDLKLTTVEQAEGTDQPGTSGRATAAITVIPELTAEQAEDLIRILQDVSDNLVRMKPEVDTLQEMAACVGPIYLPSDLAAAAWTRYEGLVGRSQKLLTRLAEFAQAAEALLQDSDAAEDEADGRGVVEEESETESIPDEPTPPAAAQSAASSGTRRSRWRRVLLAALPLQAMLVLLLGAACLVPQCDDSYACVLANNFARSMHPMLKHMDGPPPF